MKRYFISMFLILVLMGTALAVSLPSVTSLSSGILSASRVVVVGPARLTDLAVYTNGTNAVTVTLYDSATSATGNVIGKVIVQGASYNGGLYIPVPVKAIAGIYCSISGTGGSAIVFFDPQN